MAVDKRVFGKLQEELTAAHTELRYIYLFCNFIVPLNLLPIGHLGYLDYLLAVDKRLFENLQLKLNT